MLLEIFDYLYNMIQSGKLNVQCLCNVLVLMLCSDVDPIIGCLCNFQVLKLCFGVDAMFGCLRNVWVLMQFSLEDTLFTQLVDKIAIASSTQLLACFKTSLAVKQPLPFFLLPSSAPPLT